MSTVNPFQTATPAAAPVAPTAAPVPPTAPAAAPVPPTIPTAPTAPAAETVGTIEKKPRKKPNRQMTAEERKYVLNNYATKNTSEIAEELNLTRQQVYRTVHESRSKLQEKLTNLEAMPSTPEIEVTKSKIVALLNSLPAKPFGAGQGGGRKGSSIDNVLDDLLA